MRFTMKSIIFLYKIKKRIPLSSGERNPNCKNVNRELHTCGRHIVHRNILIRLTIVHLFVRLFVDLFFRYIESISHGIN